MRRDVELEGSILTESGKQTLVEMLFRNKRAFSLHSEVGNCPGVEATFDLTSEDPFYIRPYRVSQSEKILIDKELDKLVKMGVLEQGMTDFSSPVMLISKKGTTEKRVVTDFRYLNQRIRKYNHPFPLVRDAMQVLGASKCKMLSVMDLKDAYHSLNLSPKCRRYCGITSYFGGKSYFYKKLGMGLNIAPSVWQSQIDKILGTIPDCRNFCLAIMDDLLVFSKDESEHMSHVEQVLEKFSEYGLKVSPRKCKLFKDEVTYMGHTILVKDGRPCIAAMKDKTDAIRHLPVPTTVRKVRGFVGAVNYLSMFVPKLQELLRPLYDLTKKGCRFVWCEKQQDCFDAIKKILVTPPALTMPRSHGLLRLYSDTSRVATGASLWQIQDGQERLLAFHSKVLPPSAARYGVSELELTGLFLNIQAFRHILRGAQFEAYCDHSALVNIMRSKSEPPTMRFKKLIEKLSGYDFQLGYKKGKDLVLADFLSRNPHVTDEDPNEATPVALSFMDMEGDKISDYAFPCGETQGRPITRAYARSHNIFVPPITKVPGSQSMCPTPKVVDNTPAEPVVSITTARTTRVPRLQPDFQRIAGLTARVDQGRKDTLVNDRLENQTTSLIGQIPLTTENGITNTYTKPSGDMYHRPSALITNISDTNILRKHIPKQAEIDKMLNLIKRKVLRDYHLPVNVHNLRREQRQCPHFRDVYGYITSGLLPAKKCAARRVIADSEHYILIEGVLFRVIRTPEKEGDCKVSLAVPESMAAQIISLYHDSLLACHQGVTRTYITLRQKFYIPGLYDKIYAYIRSCQVCQQKKPRNEQQNEFALRIPTEYCPMQYLQADIKSMPEGYRSHRYICCEITRYVLCIPMTRIDAPALAEAILQRCVLVFGPPKRLVFDEDRALGGKVMQFMLEALKVDVKFISPQNHGSLVAERQIRTVAESRVVWWEMAGIGICTVNAWRIRTIRSHYQQWGTLRSRWSIYGILPVWIV